MLCGNRVCCTHVVTLIILLAMSFVMQQEVENIKKVDSKDLAVSAQELVDSYLKPGVESEVNVSDNMKKVILQLVTSGVTDTERQELLKCLERAQNEILMIMAMGAFPRFMVSTLFLEYKKKAKERQDDGSFRKPEPVVR